MAKKNTKIFNSQHTTLFILTLYARAHHRTSSQIRRAWLYACLYPRSVEGTLRRSHSKAKPTLRAPLCSSAQLISLFYSLSKALVSFETPHTHTQSHGHRHRHTHTHTAKSNLFPFFFFLWRERVYPKLVVMHSPGVRCYLFIMYYNELMNYTLWSLPRGLL